MIYEEYGENRIVYAPTSHNKR